MERCRFNAVLFKRRKYRMKTASIITASPVQISTIHKVWCVDSGVGGVVGSLVGSDEAPGVGVDVVGV